MSVTHNKILRISAAMLLAGIGCLALTKQSYAATMTEHAYIDDDGIVWRYKLEDCTANSTTTSLTLSFGYAPDPTITTVKIPSLAEIKAADNRSCIDNLDTYYFTDQTDPNHTSDYNFAAPNLTKLDMSGAAKAQLIGLAPLFKDTDGEVELVFGDDMVISEAGRSSSAPGLFEGLKLKLTNLNKVKYIGWNAFKNATLSESSTAITINSNQTVGGYVFAGTNVKSLEIDTNDTGEGFCQDCTELTSLSFGDNAKIIYGNAFQGDTQLKQVLNTNKLTEIGRYAFQGSGLTGLTVHNDLQLLKENVFEDTNLGALDFSGTDTILGNEAFKNAGVTSLNLGTKLSKIRNATFVDNKITNIVLPKSLREIGVAVFMRNPLDTMTINFDIAALNNGYSTPSRVLFGCASYVVNSRCENVVTDDSMLNLKHLIINAPYASDEEALPHSAGYGSDYIVSLRGRVKNMIPSQFFADLDNLRSIVIGEGYEFIDTQAFMRGASSKIAIGANHCPTYSGSCARVSNQKVLTKITFPDSLIAINDRAFQWFSNNKDLVINGLSSNLEYIGEQAFYMSAGTIKDLKSRKIQYIGNRAFAVGPNVEKAYIGDDAYFLGYDAFAGNHGYMDLTIDTDIYNGKINGASYGTPTMNGDFFHAFGTWMAGGYIGSPLTEYPDGFTVPSNNGSPNNYNHHYKKITFTNKVVTAPAYGTYLLEGMWCDTIDMSAAQFKTLPSNTLLFVKANEVKLPSGLETIEYNAVQAAQIKKTLVLPNSIKTIRANAFHAVANNEVIGNVKINALPQSLETIEYAAFYGQKNVKVDVTNPNIKMIGNASFMGTSVRDITLGGNLETLQPFAFFNIPTLRNVTIDVNFYDGSLGYDATGWDTFVWAFGNKENRFGTIKLTSNAGQPCDGFGNCQAKALAANTTCKDSNNEVIDCDRKNAYFYGINANVIDLSEVNMTTVPVSMFQNSTVGTIILPGTVESIGEDAFYQARIGDMNMPDSIETIGKEAFQWAKGDIDDLPAGLKTIGNSAFYGAAVMDDIVLSASIESIGTDAFNAGDRDVHYDTVSIEGDLTFAITHGQLIHQMFWNSDISTLILNGSTIPTLSAQGSEETTQEFWSMPMEEVVITALPRIPVRAFEKNSNLKMLVMRRDTALRVIDEEAFLDCEKLHVIKFASDLADKPVVLGQNSFKNTGFTTIGNDEVQFNLAAAQFSAGSGYVFTNMKKLTTVNIPESFNGGIVPAGLFANASELTEATVDQGVIKVLDGAFANTNKLERMIFWGDTIIEDTTIPLGTNIYGYTGMKPEEYANARTGEGKFYPLDEVLYIATNRTRVTQDDTADLDTDNITVYALRRDGTILESDTWGEFDGNAYPRSDSDIHFTGMAAAVAEDPAAGTVFDTPVPVAELDLSSENFTNIDYSVAPVADSSNTLATISYTDGDTGNTATNVVLVRSAAAVASQQTEAGEPGRGEAGDDAPMIAAVNAAANVATSKTVNNAEPGRGGDDDEDDVISSETKDAIESAANEAITTTGSDGAGNPSTNDQIMGYVALFISSSILGGAAIAINHRRKR